MAPKLRWYDHNPTVSLAVSVLRNAKPASQEKAATFIIEQAKSKGVKLEKATNDIIGNLTRRWYDRDEVVFNAFEYLKIANDETQKELALELIDYLYTIEHIVE